MGEFIEEYNSLSEEEKELISISVESNESFEDKRDLLSFVIEDEIEVTRKGKLL